MAAMLPNTARPGMPVIEVVDYDPSWPALFSELGGELREALGTVAPRIDHIGSTAIPALAAKPIIDVQISVADFDPLDDYRIPLQDLGFVHRADNPELTKRYFREAPGSRRRRTHVHVRRGYAAVKRRLAREFGGDRHGYTEAKVPHIWQIIQAADQWAQELGWRPPASDA